MAAVISNRGQGSSVRTVRSKKYAPPKELSMKCLIAIAIICTIGGVVGRYMASNANGDPALVWSGIGLAVGGCIGGFYVTQKIAMKLFAGMIRL